MSHELKLSLLMLAAGMLGGVTNFLRTEAQQDKNGILLAKHVLLAVSASILIPLFLNTISSGLLQETATDSLKLFVFFGFCLAASLSSQSFIQTVSEKVLKELGDKARQNEAEIKAVVESNAALDQKVSKVESRSNKLVSNIETAHDDPTKYTPVDLSNLENHGIPRDLASDIARRYQGVSNYYDDPLTGFGESDNLLSGRKIEARVERAKKGWGLYEAILKVSSMDPERTPLPDSVIFLVHHTLPPQLRLVRTNEDGTATLHIPTMGTFIAGAIIPNEDTRLAFNLDTAEGADDEFKNN